MPTKVEVHPFLNEERLRPKGMRFLIVGTFPAWEFSEVPRQHFNPLTMLDIPYGRVKGSARNYLWEIMFSIFKEKPLAKPADLFRFLRKNHIGMCDVFKKIKRKKEYNSSDSNLLVVETNLAMIKFYLERDKVQRILTTSKIVENYFDDEIKNNYEIVNLPAPSGSGNRAIGGLPEYKKLKAKDDGFDTLKFRMTKYKEAFML